MFVLRETPIERWGGLEPTSSKGRGTFAEPLEKAALPADFFPATTLWRWRIWSFSDPAPASARIARGTSWAAERRAAFPREQC